MCTALLLGCFDSPNIVLALVYEGAVVDELVARLRGVGVIVAAFLRILLAAPA